MKRIVVPMKRIVVPMEVVLNYSGPLSLEEIERFILDACHEIMAPKDSRFEELIINNGKAFDADTEESIYEEDYDDQVSFDEDYGQER